MSDRIDSDFRWGTVTQASPLRVQLDGDTAALPVTPDTLIDPLTIAVSDRVRCELALNRVIVHGKTAASFYSRAQIDALFPAGLMMPCALATAPAGWLLCDGSAVSRTTYAALFAVLNVTIGTPTVTIASPGVFTLNSHGMKDGQKVYLTTTGALPTGLAANTAYFVTGVTTNTFKLATSYANALAVTAINTSGSQSGTHTIVRTFGVGNGSTTFNVPDLKGQTIVGVDSAQIEFDALGESSGAKTHTLTLAQTPAHSHAIVANGGVVRLGVPAGGGHPATGGGGEFSYGTDSQGGGGAHNNLQPYVALNYLIKT